MLEEGLGRLINGALWGLGAGLVLSVTRGNGGEGVRGVTKTAMRGYLMLADRVQETTAVLRENFDDLAAEVRAERASEAEDSSGEAP
jgi:hypothetical protein